MCSTLLQNLYLYNVLMITKVMIVCEPYWDLMPLMLFVIAAAVQFCCSITRLGSRGGSSAGRQRSARNRGEDSTHSIRRILNESTRDLTRKRKSDKNWVGCTKNRSNLDYFVRSLAIICSLATPNYYTAHSPERVHFRLTDTSLLWKVVASSLLNGMLGWHDWWGRRKVSLVVGPKWLSVVYRKFRLSQTQHTDESYADVADALNWWVWRWKRYLE